MISNLPSPYTTALNFLGGVTGDRVDFGTAPSVSNLGNLTCSMLFYSRTTYTTQQVFFNKVPSVGVHRYFFAGVFGIEYLYGRSTSGQNIVVTPTNFPTYALNKWLMLVVQTDDTTNGNNQMFMGDESSPPVETSSYVTQVAGSGTFRDDSAGSLLVGVNGALAAGFDGLIADFSIWNRRLNASERLDVWNVYFPKVGGLLVPRPFPTNGLVISSRLGADGYGTCLDTSGYGNVGTITTATPRPGPWESYVGQEVLI